MGLYFTMVIQQENGSPCTTMLKSLPMQLSNARLLTNGRRPNFTRLACKDKIIQASM